MKFFILFSAITILLISASDCGKKTTDTVYKGRLEIKAICSNYTIGVVEGNIDTALIVANWTDENTGKAYKNVFKLDEPCNFPATINQGDEFYFKVDTSLPKGCIVCMAYYPVPPKKLQIVVVEK
jgi:hypothetical protein